MEGSRYVTQQISSRGENLSIAKRLEVKNKQNIQNGKVGSDENIHSGYNSELERIMEIQSGVKKNRGGRNLMVREISINGKSLRRNGF